MVEIAGWCNMEGVAPKRELSTFCAGGGTIAAFGEEFTGAGAAGLDFSDGTEAPSQAIQ